MTNTIEISELCGSPIQLCNIKWQLSDQWEISNHIEIELPFSITITFNRDISEDELRKFLIDNLFVQHDALRLLMKNCLMIKDNTWNSFGFDKLSSDSLDHTSDDDIKYLNYNSDTKTCTFSIKRKGPFNYRKFDNNQTLTFNKSLFIDLHLNSDLKSIFSLNDTNKIVSEFKVEISRGSRCLLSVVKL